MVLTRRFLYLALGLSAVVVVFPAQATLLVCALLLVLIAGTDMVLAGSPRSLRVERVPTTPVRLGQATTASTTITHTGSRRLHGQVKDGWQPSAGARRQISPLELGPGRPAGRGPAGARSAVPRPGAQLATARIETRLRPTRRGDLHSEHLSVRSIGPLGLAGRQVTHRVQHAQRVLPPFHSRRHLPSKLQRLRELDGATAVQIRGAGHEFDSLRDYVRGDDVRSIDWRATARRQSSQGQHLVVRTWRPERDRRVILALDSSRTSAVRIEDEPRLDSGMEAALLLGALAAGAGDRVDYFSFDRALSSQARSGMRGDLLHQMAEAMATVAPRLVEADFSQLPGQIRAISSQRSLLVVLTSLDSGSLEEGLLPVLPALTERHLVVLAAVRDPELDRRARARESAGEVYRAAAAERALIEKEALRRQLASLGVEVVEATPHQLPPQLADTYIRLKASGRL
ncbi:DUF58 domain-containing protein [Nesterenkonia sandarakina]|uniref:Uncharacterized protein (DUF58 family) n=1 Tax=Nesterenkonia sandarakina TaxID=272918 RepID=A0A2T0YGR4_9MICC|nr:DUF58 domain-containing protein [Nesterenkonia sandarakina]PRZ14197.1 uncharacterized protein (DUF58 family) [Nesterenkonia sandarakina]